jgi:hypothetical protein
MVVTYTNQIETNISEPLYALLVAEFNPVDIRMHDVFEPEFMTRGEYIRYWFLDSTEISRFAQGETRQYEIEIVYYFDLVRSRPQKAFNDLYSERLERLKRLLDNNTSYDDGTYRWHKLEIDIMPIQTVEDLEGIEEETSTMALKFTVLLTRNNIIG